jgi:DNA gyrase subunit A
MRLARLTGLEMEKLEAELEEVRPESRSSRSCSRAARLRMQVIRDELDELAEKYGDERRTRLSASTPTWRWRTSSPTRNGPHPQPSGIREAHPDGTYRAQRRGGRGLQGMGTKEEDWVEHLFVASTHDVLMIFTRDGQCHWLKVWQIPRGVVTPAGSRS